MAKHGFFRKDGSARRGTPNKAPLRLIIDREPVSLGQTEDGVEIEVIKERLSCGHLQSPVKDFAGETNATRRRCRQCQEETED